MEFFGPVEPAARTARSAVGADSGGFRRGRRLLGTRRGEVGRVMGLALLGLTLLLTGTARAEARKQDSTAPAVPSKDAGADAGGAAGNRPTGPAVEQERTEKDGEKSYQFQAVEVEGRLKAPQILYFLRRVRAELRAGRLGHRSFLPELRDTRRSAALR